ncbi:hypothetical protein SK128_006862, partial [Halocaridina rubra]
RVMVRVWVIWVGYTGGKPWVGNGRCNYGWTQTSWHPLFFCVMKTPKKLGLLPQHCTPIAFIPASYWAPTILLWLLVSAEDW